MDKRRAAANLLRVTKSLEAIDDDESESALSEADSDPQSSRTITRTPTSPKVRADGDDDSDEHDDDEDSDREMDEDELLEHAAALLGKKDPKFALFYVSQSLRLNPNRTDGWLLRADCNLELDRPADAALDCNRSLALDGKDATMYCRRARCMQRLRRLADAVEDAEYATYLGGCDDAKDILDEVRIQKRIVEALEAKNHYTALGVPQNAGDLDIKLAYKAACMKWHPDRWARAPDTERELAELCFKECNTAHQVLADGESRTKYDFYLHQRQFDPSLPHPMDAPHHYQYVQHAQHVAQQKQWAAQGQPQQHMNIVHPGARTPSSLPGSQCSSPLSYSSTPMSPQWAFGGYPFPMSPMSPNLRSPSHGLHHAFGGRY